MVEDWDNEIPKKPVDAVPDGSAGFCPNCGAPHSPADRFCPKCGRPLAANTTPAALVSSAASIASEGSAIAVPSSRRVWFILGAVIFVAIVAAALFISLSGNGLFSPHHAITG